MEDEKLALLLSFINKGKIALQKKVFEKSIMYFEKAEALFPNPIECATGTEELYLLLGNAYFDMRQFDYSRKYYQKSQQCIDKRQLNLSSFKIGKTFFEEGNKVDAKTYFMKVYQESGKKYFYKEDSKYYHLISSFDDSEKIEEPFKTYKGKNYTEKQWVVFEQELYNEFQKKRHV